MIRYFYSFIAKFGLTLIALWIIGFIFNLTFGEVLLTSVILTIVSFLGDVFLLPKVGPVLGAALDFILAFILIWAIGTNLFTSFISYEGYALVSAMVLTLFEVIFHKLIQFEFLNPKRTSQSFQTEFAKDESNEDHFK
jgi:hypothetical protein